MWLKQTHRSHVDPSRIYGLQGEELTLLSRHGHVLCVKGKSGTFSVEEHMISEEPVEPAEAEELVKNPVPGKKGGTKKQTVTIQKLF